MPSSEGNTAPPLPANQPTTRLFLVRHGQSTWNREHRIQGQLDPPLSEEGRLQARRLGRRLAGRKFAALYASDLGRAMQTAEEIAAFGGPRPDPVPALREIFLGGWEGLRTEEVAVRYPEEWARWSAAPDWDLVAGGEGASRFEARIGAAVDGILRRHPHGDVLAVTHGGVIQVALHRLVGRSSYGLFSFKIQNASISLLEWRGGRCVIGGANDVAHLEDALVTEPGPS